MQQFYSRVLSGSLNSADIELLERKMLKNFQSSVEYTKSIGEKKVKLGVDKFGATWFEKIKSDKYTLYFKENDKEYDIDLKVLINTRTYRPSVKKVLCLDFLDSCHWLHVI